MTTNADVKETEHGYAGVSIQHTPHPLVRYASDQVVYVESSDGERWLGRFWSADGRVNVPGESWSAEAFQIAIDEEVVRTGWQVVSVTELERDARDGRHVVVELSNRLRPLTVRVHTLLDGTPVIVRWLEITNTSTVSIGLTEVAPWSGRLWPGRNFTLGYYTKDVWACEGWFEWEALPVHLTQLKCDKGQGHDAPFFVVRNEVTGEYFIGHLAWSANWTMDFTRDGQGLLFRVGPDAVPCQRVIQAGETVKTPAVHLGHVSGSLDQAVQAMHDHLRRSVLPRLQPERAYRIQYLVPADQG
jgi:alpha-galactosidase